MKPGSASSQTTDPDLISVSLSIWKRFCTLIASGYSSLDKPFTKPGAALAIRLAFGIFTFCVILGSFLVPDVPTFQRPELARIFFWHFPCPMLGSTLLMMGTYYSLRYTQTHDAIQDAKAYTILRIGFLFCLLTMATGIIFSKSEWGAWWQWDPRQTSFLLLILIFGAYFVLRAAYSDPEKKASYASAYILAAILPSLFLTFVFPRLPQVAAVSLHPTSSIIEGQIKGWYAVVIWLTLFVATVITIWLYRIEMRLRLIELNQINYELEISRGSAANAVMVRPIRLLSDSRSEGESTEVPN